MRTSFRPTALRSTALGAVVLTLGLGMTACSSGSDSGSKASDSGSKASDSSSMASSSPSEAAMAAGDQTFGPACSAIPKTGAGSFDGMVQDPVATAASNNPLLSTLVTAVTKAGLVDTLNGAEALTVFAPTNDAFAKLPKKDLDAVLADKALLTKILTHHVVGQQLDPQAVVGKQDTLNKDTVTVSGSAEDGMEVDGAKVLCGNIPTANATVYVVDSVLMP